MGTRALSDAFALIVSSKNGIATAQKHLKNCVKKKQHEYALSYNVGGGGSEAHMYKTPFDRYAVAIAMVIASKAYILA